MKRHHGRSLAAVLVTAAFLVSACGGGESDDSTATDSGTPSGAQGRPTGMPSFDPSQLENIQKCLDAAGIEIDIPTDTPTDMPSDFPTDMPTDMPTDFPSDMPTDFPTDGAQGGLGSLFSSPEAREALEACGIESPSGPSGQ